MWNLVSVRLETVLVSVQGRCMVCAKRTISKKSFWTHPMVLLRDEAQVEASFGPLGDSANFDADTCTVCAKRTIGSEIVSDTPDGTPSRQGSSGSLF